MGFLVSDFSNSLDVFLTKSGKHSAFGSSALEVHLNSGGVCRQRSERRLQQSVCGSNGSVT